MSDRMEACVESLTQEQLASLPEFTLGTYYGMASMMIRAATLSRTKGQAERFAERVDGEARRRGLIS